MFPGTRRINELRERFGVISGQFWDENRFKNLNWYFTTGSTINRDEPGEWFCYGDIRDEDVPRLQEILKDGELLVLGWKDLSPDERSNKILGDGGGVRIAIANAGVIYDVRRDGPIRES